ncbi:3873_t:CDS:2, partial [Racocetra persica]
EYSSDSPTIEKSITSNDLTFYIVWASNAECIEAFLMHNCPNKEFFGVLAKLSLENYIIFSQHKIYRIVFRLFKIIKQTKRQLIYKRLRTRKFIIYIKQKCQRKHRSIGTKSFNYSQFSEINIIGRGGSAVVYSATFQEKKYALKSLNDNLFLDKKRFKKIKRELDNLCNVCHPNIIEIFGTSRDSLSGNFMLVLQFANGGNLRDHLQRKQQDNIYKISWSELIQIAKEITLGLEHLHNNEIIHRDLHSKNILMNDGKALIADFGISKQLNDTTESSSNSTGIVAYADPRYLKEEIIANTPSDYAHIIEKCWSSDTDQRPTLNQILIKLENLSKGTTVEFITNKYVKNNQQMIKLCKCHEESNDDICLKHESQILLKDESPILHDNKVESNNDIHLKNDIANDPSKLYEVIQDAPKISNEDTQLFTGTEEILKAIRTLSKPIDELWNFFMIYFLNTGILWVLQPYSRDAI